MRRRLLLLLLGTLTGCKAALPDRITLGVQLDADSLEPKTYVVQGQWIVPK